MFKRALEILLTIPVVLLLLLTLIIWQPLIVLTKPLYKIHKSIIELGNFFLLSYLRIIGGSISTEWHTDAPKAGPVIIISNHQSYFDIPIFIWVFRRYYAKFVAKKSLGRWLPSISYVLRTGGSALIDRGSARQALPKIAALGKYVVDHSCAACIFPEGTRAKDGVLKPFKPHGAKALLEAAPNVTVLPVAILGAWKLMQHNLWPIPFGVKIKVKVGAPIPRLGSSSDEIIARCHQTIAALLNTE